MILLSRHGSQLAPKYFVQISVLMEKVTELVTMGTLYHTPHIQGSVNITEEGGQKSSKSWRTRKTAAKIASSEHGSGAVPTNTHHPWLPV